MTKQHRQNLIAYKQLTLDTQGKLKFFLEKHSTQEGVWGQLRLTHGTIEFIFTDGQGNSLSTIELNEQTPSLQIPPASWHKINPISAEFSAELTFYCKPHRYFSRKYGLGEVHSDLYHLYHTYLQQASLLNVLDVGCGSGRNLLYLAHQGHTVTGLDMNQSALDQIQRIAKQEELSHVNTTWHDLNTPLSLGKNQYELIVSTVTLQFLEAKQVPTLLNCLQEATQPNGYHLLVFPIQSDLYAFPPFFTFLPESKALYHFYQDSGWSILEYDESVGHLHKKDEAGRPIRGQFARLLAQKIR